MSALSLAAVLSAELSAEPFKIGVIVDGPWAGNQAVSDLTKSEILTLTEGEFQVEFPEEFYLIGDWTLETAQRNFAELLAEPEVDLVIGWGLLASHAACCYFELPKPVIAPVIIDVELQGLPFHSGTSGAKNLSYVSLPDNLAHQLRYFQRLVPFRHVGILVMKGLMEAIPELALRALPLAEKLGLTIEHIPVDTSADEVLKSLPSHIDAVYMWPVFQLESKEYLGLIKGLNDRKLPTFSALGREDVKDGMLASLASDDFFPRLARRVALNVQRILLGENAGSIPVGFDLRERLTINMATARLIGVSPRWELLVEARLLNLEDVDGLKKLDLSWAVHRAVGANLDIMARRNFVAGGSQETRSTRSNLLPRIESSLQALRIDEDRAAASFGSQPERSSTGGLQLSQLLYSDAALGNLAIQRKLQLGRTFDLETLRLDIALQASTTYLNLLRAKSLVQVQRNNLELTRSNLEVARIRKAVGAANPAEVFRWESQIATDRNALVKAMADQRVAEIAVSRLLHLPLEERFLTVEISPDDPSLTVGQGRFTGYIETPHRFEVLRAFSVEEGLSRSPELQQFDALIAAQERSLRSAKRAFWAPTVGLAAVWEEILSKGGAGSESGFSLGGATSLPGIDDSSWSVALTAALPLFSGGSRVAERTRAEEELKQLRLERESVAEKIEQNIRSAMHVARASYTGIRLSEEAGEAARKSLDLVSDAYARGAVSILDLLDAQNAALNAEELAANAGYDFLVDLMEVQRVINRFDFFQGSEEQEEWFRRLERHFAEAGIPPLEAP
jgi:outer membrane protein TolC